MNKRMLLVRAVLVTASLLACSRKDVLPTPTSTPVALGDRLWAGVARADVTPPPGLALFAHAIEGRVATGTRLRLQCTAFVLGSGNDVVAMVPCDLSAASLELHRYIAQRLTERGVPIGADRLALMATHTHAGPAHYFGARMYSGTFSSRIAGFDHRVVEFLGDRIAAAVENAWNSRAPACVAWGRRAVYGLSRNRSLGPFFANVHLPVELQDAFWHENPLHQRFTPAELAVDPKLSVLRIDRTAPESVACEGATPLGVFAMFGMHPTAIANTNDLYHGDVFGYATREVECRLTKKEPAQRSERTDACTREHLAPLPDHPPILSGLANGIEGDVSPAWDQQTPREARRIGTRLAEEILTLHEELEWTMHPAARIQHVYRELLVPHRLAALGEKTCDRPEIGTAFAAGAEDGPTRFRIVPQFNEGVRAPYARGCEGYKLPLVGPEGPLRDDGLDFPAVAPIQILRIGDVLLATAPVELSTVAGLRIRDAVRSVARAHPRNTAPIKDVIVGGLTNSYLSYVATREEYALQHYEGASTLYGPNTALLLQNQFACLAGALFGERTKCSLDQPYDVNTVHPVAYDPDIRVQRLPDDTMSLGQTWEPHDLKVDKAPEDGWEGWQVRWNGPPPEYLQHRRRLTVDVARIGPKPDQKEIVVDDDRGSSIVVRRQVDKKTGDAFWSASWVPGIIGCHGWCGQIFRFVIRGPSELRSETFMLDCGPRAKEQCEPAPQLPGQAQ
jgi:neutral ceramidase